MSFFPALHGLAAAIKTALNLDDGSYYWYANDLGPVSYWRLDETSGTTATDDAGTQNGTYVNTPVLGAPPGVTDSSGSVDFDSASTEYVNIPNNAAYNALTSTVSWSFWLFLETWPQQSTAAALLAKDLVSGNRPWTIYISTFTGNLELSFYGRNNSTGDATQYKCDMSSFDIRGQWVHVVFTWSSGTGKFYFNGVEWTEVTNSATGLTTLMTTTDPIRIANDNRASQDALLDGRVDEVSIYNKILTPLEVLELYTRGVLDTGSYYDYAAKVLSPMAYWRLDEAGASYASAVKNDGALHYWKLDDTGSTAVDSVGSADMTYTGSPTVGEPTLVYGESSAVTFNGTTQYALHAVQDFRGTDSEGTIEAWVRTTATAAGTILASCIDNGTWRQFSFEVDAAGVLSFVWYDVDVDATFDLVQSTNAINDGLPHHVVLTSDGSTYRMYIDGIEETLTVPSGTNDGRWFSDFINTARDNVTLGVRVRSNLISYFDGTIDEVAYYDAPLTAAQVLDHYSLGAPSALDSVGSLGGMYTNFPLLAQPSLLDGEANTAVRFDGIDQSIDFTNAIGAAMDGNAATTVCAWVKPEVVDANYRLVFCVAYAHTIGLHLQFTNAITWSYGMTPGAGASGSALTYGDRLEQGKTYFLAAVHDYANDRIDLFINGQLAVSEDIPFAATYTHDGTGTTWKDAIGSGGTGSRHFAGTIDEVTMYPTALTPAQIAELYLRGKPLDYKDIVLADSPYHYWRMGGTARQMVRDEYWKDHFNHGTTVDTRYWYTGVNAAVVAAGEVTIDNAHNLRSGQRFGGDFSIEMQWDRAATWTTGMTQTLLVYNADNTSENRFIYREFTSERITGSDGTTYNYDTRNWMSGYFKIERIGTGAGAIKLYMKQNIGDSWIQRSSFADFTNNADAFVFVYSGNAASWTSDWFSVTAEYAWAYRPYFNYLDEMGNAAVPEIGTLTVPPQAADRGVGGLIVGSDRATAFRDAEYIELPDMIEPGTGSMTYEAWVMTNGLANAQGIIATGRRGSGAGVTVLIDGNDNLQILIDDGTTQVSVTSDFNTFEVNKAYHVVAVIDRTLDEIRLYTNGVLVGTGDISTVTGSLTGGYSNGAIGTYQFTTAYDNFFDGIIDEVAVYQSVLSAERILAHYSAGRYGAYAEMPQEEAQLYLPTSSNTPMYRPVGGWLEPEWFLQPTGTPPDPDRWRVQSYGNTDPTAITKNSWLRLVDPHVNGTASEVRIESRYYLKGDFDIEMDFTGFNNGNTQCHCWLGVRSVGYVGPWNNAGTKYFSSYIGTTFTNSAVRANDVGKMRVTRVGSTITTYKDDNVGSWTQVDSRTGSTDPNPIWVRLWSDATATTGDAECLTRGLIINKATLQTFEYPFNDVSQEDGARMPEDQWALVTGNGAPSSSTYQGYWLDGKFRTRIVHTSNSDGFNTVGFHQYAYRLIGDFRIEINFSNLVLPQNQMGCLFMASGLIWIGAIRDSATNYFSCHSTDSGTGATAARTNDNGGMRIERVGTTVTVYYKDGAGSYTQLYTYGSANTDPVSVLLYHYTYNDTTASGTLGVDWATLLVTANGLMKRGGVAETGKYVCTFDATVHNQPSLVPGGGDASIRFIRNLEAQGWMPGSNTYGQNGIKHELDNLFSQGPATIECWIRPTDVNALGYDSGRLISKDADGSAAGDDLGWAISYSGSTSQSIGFFQRYASGALTDYCGWSTPTDSIVPGGIYHVVVVYDASDRLNDAAIYINGVPQTLTLDNRAASGYTATNDTNTALYVGNADQSQAQGDILFDGWIDEIAIYRHPLSAAKVMEHYKRGLDFIDYEETVFEDSAEFHWRLDDFNGDQYKDTISDKHPATTVGDPHWGNVRILLHGNGTNGGTTFTEETGLRSWTRSGNVVTSTAQSKFGGSSLYFDGTTDFLYSTTDLHHFDVQDTDFTIEAWVYLVAYPSAGNWATVFSTFEDTSEDGLRLLIGDDGRLHMSMGLQSGGNHWGTVLSTGQWHHVAYCRRGGFGQTFIDGVGGNTDTCTSLSTGVTRVQVGATNASGVWSLNGYLNEVRFTLGVARYWGWFTPPSAPFGDNHLNYVMSWDNMRRIVSLNGTDQKIAAGNGYQGVSGNDVSFECIFRTSSAQTGSNGIFANYGKNVAGQLFLLGMYGSAAPGRLFLWDGSGAVETGTSTYNDGKWHHLVAVCGTTSHTGKLYIDGVDFPVTTTGTSVSTSIVLEKILSVGNYSTAVGCFDGEIEKVSLYSAKLTEEEIRQHYHEAVGDLKSRMMRDNPIGLWTFGETSGTTAFDEMGVNDGTYGTGVTTNYPPFVKTADTVLRSVVVDGTTDATSRIDLGFSTNYATFSMEIWCKLYDFPDQSGFLFSKSSYFATAITDFPFGLQIGSTGAVVANWSKGDDFNQDVSINTGAGAITPGKVHHIVAVFKDQRYAELWLDGVLIERVAVDFSLSTNSRNWCVGAPAFGNGGGANTAFLDNTMAQMCALYDSALTAEAIQERWALGYADLYYDAVMALGPVSYWRLDDPKGTQALDVMGANHGTYQNTVGLNSWSHVVGGQASAYFDGVNENVSLAVPFTVNTETEISVALAFTMSAEAGGNERHMFFSGDNGQFELFLNTAGDLIWAVKDSASTEHWSYGMVKPAISHTYHVVATWKKGGQSIIYVNGRMMGNYSVPDLYMFDGGATTTRIGADSSGTTGFNGSIDEVALFRKELTPAEALALYKATGMVSPQAIASSQPVAYYQLHETSGTTAADKGNKDVTRYNGTYAGSYTLGQPSIIDNTGRKCLYLDGGNGRVDLNNTGAMATLYQGDYTLEAWVRPEDVPPGIGADYDANRGVLIQPGYHQGMQLSRHCTPVISRWHTGDAVTGTFSQDGNRYAVTPGKTHHLVGVVDKARGELLFYVDGQLYCKAGFTPGLAARTNAAAWMIGHATPGSPTADYASPFKGHIQDVAMYDRILTPGEIMEHYNASLSAGDTTKALPTDYQYKMRRMGPHLYWPLAELGGTTARNEQCYDTSFDGTITSMSAFGAVGIEGRNDAMTFNGATPSYVSVADAASLKRTFGSITIAAWIRIASVGYGIIANKSSGSGSNGNYMLYTNNAGDGLVFSFWRGSGGNEYFQNAVQVDLTDGWHHVAVTHLWGSSGTKMYIDGVDLGGAWTGQDGTGTPYTSTDVFKVGARSQDNAMGFSGDMQHVGFWNRYLSAEEIAELATVE